MNSSRNHTRSRASVNTKESDPPVASRTKLYWYIACGILSFCLFVGLVYLVTQTPLDVDSWTDYIDRSSSSSSSSSDSSTTRTSTDVTEEFLLAGVSSSEETSDLSSISSDTSDRGYSLRSEDSSSHWTTPTEDQDYYAAHNSKRSVSDVRVPVGHPGTNQRPVPIDHSNVRLDNLGIAGSIMERYSIAEGYACDETGIPVLTELDYPRNISNAVFQQGDSVDPANFTAESTLGVNTLFVFFGQFVDHQLVLTAPSPVETFKIRIWPDDPYISGEPNITVRRLEFAYIDECRQAFNRKSSFIDLATVYGSSFTVANDLRTHEHGRLRTLEINNRQHLPISSTPLNEADMRATAGQVRFFAGDPRVSEVPPLTAVHTLFVRNHNFIADKMRAVDKRARKWSDDQLYSRARMINIWIMQRILYREWLPMLLGEDVIQYIGTSYNHSVNPLVRHESTIIMRIGHDMLPPNISYVLPENYDNPSVRTNIALRNSFFNTALIIDKGSDSYMMGMLTQPAQEIDGRITDDVRSFLFSNLGTSVMHDLPAITISRSDELGIPRCDDFRSAIGMPPVTNADLQRPIPPEIASIYPSPSDLHVFTCAVLENHVSNALVGPMTKKVLLDQFVRMAVSDPTFFTFVEMIEFERAMVFGEHGTMAGVIKNNMDIGYLAPECVETIDNPFLINTCYN